MLVPETKKFARNLLVEGSPTKLTYNPPPVEVFENEYIELPPNAPDTVTGTLKKAEFALRENWFDEIKRLELPELILNVPTEVSVMEVVALRAVVTPLKLTFPFVLWIFKFPPATISNRSPGTTNLRP